MIDIGVNLLHEQFAADRDAVLARARQAGVEHLVITGTDVADSRAAATYVAQEAPVDGPGLSSTAGVHPHHAKDVAAGWLDELEALVARPAVRAVGETGLDFHRNFSPPEIQEQVFRDQLALARRLSCPVFVHDRNAGARVAACLRELIEPERVVVHCFTGTREDLERYLDFGCWIGITGWVCDRRRGEDLRALVPEIPPQRLLVETDAPYLRPHDAPRDEHGRRNEPALLRFVVERLAGLYGFEVDELAAVTSANARRFFSLP